MTHSSLSQMLLSDIGADDAPDAEFAAAARPAMLLEHLLAERRMVGEILQNLEALIDCAGACINDRAAGKMSGDDLTAALIEAVQIAGMELAYDEAEALAAAIDA